MSLPEPGPDAFLDYDVIHFIDNTSALYGLVKGYSSTPDHLAIIRAFHLGNLHTRANVWFNYVASKANVADRPSRGAITEMASILSSFIPSFSLTDHRVPFVLPPFAHGVSAIWEAVSGMAAPAGPSRSRGGKRRHRRSSSSL